MKCHPQQYEIKKKTHMWKTLAWSHLTKKGYVWASLTTPHFINDMWIWGSSITMQQLYNNHL
jgi:hypothetical protein